MSAIVNFPIKTGNWTPVIGGAGGTTGQTYGANNHGSYVKLGPVVIAWCYVVLSAKGTITGGVQFQGLPVTSKNTTNKYMAGAIGFFGALLTNWMSLTTYVNPNATTADIYGRQTAGATEVQLAAADIADTTQMIATLIYEAAS